MWPSEDAASRIYSWANIGLIFSLTLGVISTVLVVWLGNVKESYTAKELLDTRDRLGKAEIKAGEANDRASQDGRYIRLPTVDERAIGAHCK